MQLFFDFLPIVIFFVVYKFTDIFIATGAAIIVNTFQVMFHWIKYRTVSGVQLLSLVLIIFFGGATLFFHNTLLIKWKPTALYWILAAISLVTHYFWKKPLIQYLMETNIQLPRATWLTLNKSWSIFFLIMGGLNLWVAYFFDTNTWVNFKLFGTLGITLLFVIIQAIYLGRAAVMQKKDELSRFGE
jgi:intracellular septation protein